MYLKIYIHAGGILKIFFFCLCSFQQMICKLLELSYLQINLCMICLESARYHPFRAPYQVYV